MRREPYPNPAVKQHESQASPPRLRGHRKGTATGLREAKKAKPQDRRVGNHCRDIIRE